MSESDWPAWAFESVELVEHDPAWAPAGVLQCAHLRRRLEPWLAGDVEHVGSTAVAGLAAKPILDLQAPVLDLGVAADVAAALSGDGWHHVPPELDERPYRRFFVLVADDRRIAHLHLLLAGGERWHEQLIFRDALRSDPALAEAYAQLKDRLAQRHGDDREAYTAGKGQFVSDAIRGAAD